MKNPVGLYFPTDIEMHCVVDYIIYYSIIADMMIGKIMDYWIMKISTLSMIHLIRMMLSMMEIRSIIFF